MITGFEEYEIIQCSRAGSGSGGGRRSGSRGVSSQFRSNTRSRGGRAVLNDLGSYGVGTSRSWGVDRGAARQFGANRTTSSTGRSFANNTGSRDFQMASGIGTRRTRRR